MARCEPLSFKKAFDFEMRIGKSSISRLHDIVSYGEQVTLPLFSMQRQLSGQRWRTTQLPEASQTAGNTFDLF